MTLIKKMTTTTTTCSTSPLLWMTFIPIQFHSHLDPITLHHKHSHQHLILKQCVVVPVHPPPSIPQGVKGVVLSSEMVYSSNDRHRHPIRHPSPYHPPLPQPQPAIPNGNGTTYPLITQPIPTTAPTPHSIVLAYTATPSIYRTECSVERTTTSQNTSTPSPASEQVFPYVSALPNPMPVTPPEI